MIKSQSKVSLLVFSPQVSPKCIYSNALLNSSQKVVVSLAFIAIRAVLIGDSFPVLL